jgi:hypothetical protein
MSEEDDFDTTENDIFTFMNNCSDVSLLLNKIAPLLEINEKETKNSKKIKLAIQILYQSVMKLSNDFRSLLKYMNIMGELNLDNDDAPSFESVPNEQLWI